MSIQAFHSIIAGKRSPLTFGSASRSFDGSNDYVDCGSETSHLSTTSLSLSFWIKANTTPALNDGIIGKTNGTSWTAGYGATWRSSTTLRVWIQDFSANFVDTGALTATNWNHIVMTWDGTTITLYVNGSSSGTDSYSGTPTGTSEPLEIGRLGSDTYNTDSKIASVRIYSSDLTSGEVTTLYNQGNVTTDEVGHWLGNDDNVTDLSTAGNDATNSGSTYSTDGPFD